MIEVSSLITDSQTLARFLPNVVFEVEGEDSLFEKIQPEIIAQSAWLEKNITGAQIDEMLAATAAAIVAKRAMAQAAPQLDLVLTPNGYGVVSTSEVAPASKERVERMISSLTSSADFMCDALIDALMLFPDWRNSPQGEFLSSTFIHREDILHLWRRQNEDYFSFLSRMIDMASVYESAAAEYILGQSTLSLMHSVVAGVTTDLSRSETRIVSQAAGMVYAALLRWLEPNQRHQIYEAPSEMTLWHDLRLAARTLCQSDRINALIQSEVGEFYCPSDLIAERGALFF